MSKRQSGHVAQLCADYCAIVRGTYVVVTGWAFDPDAMVQTIEVSAGATAVQSLGLLRGRRADVSRHFDYTGRDDWGFVYLGKLEDGVKPTSLRLSVTPEGIAKSLNMAASGPFELARVKEALQPFDALERQAVLEELGTVLGVAAFEGKPVDPSALTGFVRAHLDTAVLIDSDAVFISGWLVDLRQTVTSAYVRVGDLVSDNVLPRLVRMERPDVLNAIPESRSGSTQVGFAGFVTLNALDPSGAAQPLRGGARLELLLVSKANDVACTERTLVTPTSVVEASLLLLAAFNPDVTSSYSVLDKCVGPALDRLPRPSSADCSARVWEFGSATNEPRWSVIVPLYGRYDFVFYQLAQFAWDPDFASADLIYVVDDPQIVSQVVTLASDVHPIYQVPFRVIHGGRNLGFAGANNLAARHARSERLVFLNSDVLPQAPGWLTALDEVCTSQPQAGAVGARLLYDDGSIQHDGIAFYRDPRYGEFWLNDHPGKGLPPAMAEGAPVEEVPAVTAACLMVDRSLYERVGGMDEHYILGDFEDTDLCLKLRQAGHKNYIARSVQLYHLERLSQSLFTDTDWKHRLTLYNGWRHQRRWQREIAEIVGRSGS